MYGQKIDIIGGDTFSLPPSESGYCLSLTNKRKTKIVVQPVKGEEIDGKSSVELHSQETIEIFAAKTGKHSTQWITLCAPQKRRIRS